MCRSRSQHLLFTINQIARIERSQLKSMSMRNRIGRTGLHAITTKYTSIIVNVVDMGVTFGAGKFFSLQCFPRLLCRCNSRDRRPRTGKQATHFSSPFSSRCRDVHAAKALLKHCAFRLAGTVGIVLDNRGLKHLLQGDGHSLGYGSDVFDHGHDLISIAEGGSFRLSVASSQFFLTTKDG